ncbi:MAG: DUF123 domain-containing protein [Candidatus Aminicenantes bacterium]|nr:DUF123 domain-containing protein [Candidatus Aminicenantes bacterium]
MKKGQAIKIGRFQETYFKAGYYLYVGRARRGLRARIERHLRAEKKTFWHIDSFLTKAQIIEVLIRPGSFAECRLACRLRQLLRNSVVPVPGFGASDCRCPGHLIYLSEKQDLKDVISLLKPALGLRTYP